MMTKDDIIILPNPALRKKSSRLIKPDPTLPGLIQSMIDASLDWEDSRPHEISAALAAVQINSLKRAVIIRSNFEDKSDRDFTALINPEIVKYEGKITYDHEGCLSVANIYGLVPRYSKVRVKALDLKGNEIRFKAEDFLARVIQHEIDHTNGVLFIDHIKDNPESFFELNSKGELDPLNYEQNIKTNHILWD